jgi:hypothetical protein
MVSNPHVPVNILNAWRSPVRQFQHVSCCDTDIVRCVLSIISLLLCVCYKMMKYIYIVSSYTGTRKKTPYGETSVPGQYTECTEFIVSV